MMECCLKGGPNHICPFMSKTRRSKAPGHLKTACPTGHDDGVPVTGFISVPQEVVTAVAPDMRSAALEAIEGRAIGRVAYPPSPPPKF